MALFGNYNHVVVMGNMTRDPEARTTPNGKRVINFTVAVNESVKRGDKWEDETTFVDCVAWEKTAELLERFGGKGKPVLVEGRLKMEKWQDKATGADRSKLGVVASAVTFVNGERGEGRGNNTRNDRTPPGNRRGATAPVGGEPDSGGYATGMDEDEGNY